MFRRLRNLSTSKCFPDFFRRILAATSCQKNLHARRHMRHLPAPLSHKSAKKKGKEKKFFLVFEAGNASPPLGVVITTAREENTAQLTTKQPRPQLKRLRPILQLGAAPGLCTEVTEWSAQGSPVSP